MLPKLLPNVRRHLKPWSRLAEHMHAVQLSPSSAASGCIASGITAIPSWGTYKIHVLIVTSYATHGVPQLRAYLGCEVSIWRSRPIRRQVVRHAWPLGHALARNPKTNAQLGNGQQPARSTISILVLTQATQGLIAPHTVHTPHSPPRFDAAARSRPVTRGVSPTPREYTV